MRPPRHVTRRATERRPIARGVAAALRAASQWRGPSYERSRLSDARRRRAGHSSAGRAGRRRLRPLPPGLRAGSPRPYRRAGPHLALKAAPGPRGPQAPPRSALRTVRSDGRANPRGAPSRGAAQHGGPARRRGNGEERRGTSCPDHLQGEKRCASSMRQSRSQFKATPRRVHSGQERKTRTKARRRITERKQMRASLCGGSKSGDAHEAARFAPGAAARVLFAAGAAAARRERCPRAGTNLGLSFALRSAGSQQGSSEELCRPGGKSSE